MDTNKRDQWKTLATTDNLNTANEAVASVEWVEDNQRYQLTGEVSLQRSSIIQSSLRLEIYGKQGKMADLTPLRIFLLLPRDVDWGISKKKYKTRSTGKEALAVAMSFEQNSTGITYIEVKLPTTAGECFREALMFAYTEQRKEN